MHIDDLPILRYAGIRNIPVQEIVTFEDIGIDNANLIIRKINQARVKALVRTKGNWPPIKCQGIQWGVGDHYILIDGHHRLAAAKILGLNLINAEMVECKNGREAAKAAMAANNEHGANVSRQKKNDHILWLADNGYWPEEIASIVRLSTRSVQTALKKFDVEVSGEDEPGVNNGKRLLNYINMFRSRVAHDVEAMTGASKSKAMKALADNIAIEIEVIVKNSEPSKFEEYADSMNFMGDIIDIIRNMQE